jgi:hypothetical protein
VAPRRELAELDKPRGNMAPPTPLAIDGSSSGKPILVEVKQPDPGALQTLVSLISPLIYPLATTGIVAIFVIFILLQRQDLRNRLVRLAGSGDLQRTTAAMDDAIARRDVYRTTPSSNRPRSAQNCLLGGPVRAVSRWTIEQHSVQNCSHCRIKSAAIWRLPDQAGRNSDSSAAFM